MAKIDHLQPLMRNVAAAFAVETATVLRRKAPEPFCPDADTYVVLGRLTQVRPVSEDDRTEFYGGNEYVFHRDLRGAIAFDPPPYYTDQSDPTTKWEPEQQDVWRLGDADYRVNAIRAHYPLRVTLERLDERVTLASP